MDQEGAPATIDLEEGSEWRFELENDENIAVRVSTHFKVIECVSRGRCRTLEVSHPDIRVDEADHVLLLANCLLLHLPYIECPLLCHTRICSPAPTCEPLLSRRSLDKGT